MSSLSLPRFGIFILILGVLSFIGVVSCHKKKSQFVGSQSALVGESENKGSRGGSGGGNFSSLTPKQKEDPLVNVRALSLTNFPDVSVPLLFY